MLTRTNVWTKAVRNYWWLSTVGGLYFSVSFWLWGGTRAAIISSGLFFVVAAVGLATHYHTPWHERFPQGAIIVIHLLLGQGILVWQKAFLPLSDYTRSGAPGPRDFLIYLVSSLIMGAMSIFGGAWGAVLGLTVHYAFIFNRHEEFSFKWIFPVFMALAGGIVSTAFWRLDRAYGELETLANHDSLTGLFNRHKLVSEFDRLQTLAREMEQDFLLVAWDLDGLKQVNDQDGHTAGDAYIQNFAATLQDNIRKATAHRNGDAAFRVGGDEFISMHVGIRDGQQLLARVHGSGSVVSAGWVPCNELTLDQALTRADRALYQNKEQRKNARSASAGHS
jgi:diguanylate cyclase (GGDEF)-like protein